MITLHKMIFCHTFWYRLPLPYHFDLFISTIYGILRKLSILRLHNTGTNVVILHHFGVYLSQTNLYQIYLCFKRQSLYKLQQNTYGLNCQINSFIDVANGCRKLISKNFVKKLSLNFVYTCHCRHKKFNILTSLFFSLLNM